MFTDVKFENYDLKNDFHRARFFHDCLKDELIFSKPKDFYDTRRINWQPRSVYDGIICPNIVVVTRENQTIICIDDLLCFIMGNSFDKATQLIKMYQDENKSWIEKRDEEFEKIEKKIGYVAGQKERDAFAQNNPFKFSKNVDIKVLIAFKEHFSTEHNILMALRHLSMILSSFFKKDK
jgi:hypothetical protein